MQPTIFVLRQNQLATMRFGNRLDEGKPKTNTAGPCASLVQSNEWSECILDLSCGDPGAMIADAQDGKIPLFGQ